MTAGWYLPIIVFVLLAALERAWKLSSATGSRADHWMNLAGLAVQGVVVPGAAYLLATKVLSVQWPELKGWLKIGWWGAFALNFILVDALYYGQHRLFHRVDALWKLHRCHHASSFVSVWATSRNSLLINFLFVYMLVNPLLGFLCNQPEGFFFGAALTASLDIWRHSMLPLGFTPAWLGRLLVTPAHHHLHHSPEGQRKNFGANLMLWDRMFGTAREPTGYPLRYGTPHTRSAWRQFLFF